MKPPTLQDLLRLAGDGLAPLGEDVLLVTDPDLIHQVLVTDARHVHKGRAAQRMVGILGRGSLLLDGDAWRQRRRLVQPAFKRGELARMFDAVVTRTTAHAQTWSGRMDMRPALLSLFVDLTVHNLFRMDASGRISELVAAWEILFAFMADRFADKQMSPEVLEARATIDTVLWELIAEKRRAGDDGSLLALLVAARDEEGGQLTDQELRDEVMTLFVGGYETSATALLFTLGLLSRHPTVAVRHRTEVQTQCAERPVQGSDLPSMPLNKQIIQEAMRLFPPSWLFTRSVVGEITLRDRVVPVGTQLLISPFVVHHSPDHWPNPEAFDPDRFATAPAPMTWIPFGGGPRKCLGAHYAMAELQVILPTLVRHRQIHLAPGVVLRPEARLGLMPAEPVVMDVSAPTS